MLVDRRNFLFQAGASIASATLSVSGHGPDANAPDEPTDWRWVRGQFDQLSPDHIHLSSFFLVSHPRPVREAIERHRRSIDGDPFSYVEANLETMPAKIQAAAAEYIGGRPDEVAVTNSTTMGLALVYHGLPLAEGQEVLTTEHDHFVHHEAIRLAAERAGATFKKVALFDDIRRVSRDEIVTRISKAISPKTRVVGVTWVHSSTGLKLPIRAIADVIAVANKSRAEADRILLVVDGVHGFGVEDKKVAEMGADLFIAGTHKWMFGPRGTGIVWAKAETWKQVRMVFPAFAAETFGAWASNSKLTAPMRASWIGQGGFHAFEYEWALPAAFEFHKKIGSSRIAKRIHDLNDQCKQGLTAMRKVKLYTPLGSSLSSGLICFDIEGMSSREVVGRLHAKNVIASTSPYRESYARLAPSLLNTPEEVETTLRHIRALT
jgi:isopenicillin-N epimerase